MVLKKSLNKALLRTGAFLSLMALTVSGVLPVLVPKAAATGTTIKQRIGIPAYFPPATSSDWGPNGSGGYKTFTTAGGFAIANVINGPDYAADVNYDYSGTMAAMQTAGTKVIGYVDTGYFGTTGQKTRAGNTGTEAWRDQIEQDVSAWYRFYGSKVDGIFFDQAQNSCGPTTGSNQYATLYAQVSQYAKKIALETTGTTQAMTVINPGITVPECYRNSADTILTFEGPESAYTSTNVALSWTPTDPYKIMHIVYGVSETDLATVQANSKTWGAGYVEITDEGGTGFPPLYAFLPGTITSSSTYYTSELSNAAGSGDTTAPSAPDTVDTYDEQFTTTQLNWGAATDNSGGSGVVGYDVYLKKGTGAYRFVGSTTLASYSTPNFYLNDLQPGATYTAYAVARDGAGNVSSNSNTVTWTQDTDTAVTKPSKPGSPSASGTSYSTTTLSWSASTGGDYSVSFYEVYDGSTRVLQLPASATTATIIGLTPGSSHSFTIKGVDEAGNYTTASNTVSVTLQSFSGSSVSSTGSETYTSSNVTLSAHAYLPFSFNRVFIDSDNNASTGYTVNGIGAEYVIDNGKLYRFRYGYTVGSTTYAANGGVYSYKDEVVTATPDTSTPFVLTWTIPTSNFSASKDGTTFKLYYQAEGFAPAVNSSTVTLVKS
jgi:hypothetical protein